MTLEELEKRVEELEKKVLDSTDINEMIRVYLVSSGLIEGAAEDE